ncbi:MAG TPA: MBOAT family protein [Verrucomicrobiae bacterium]|jgi:hypothetical protein
MNANSKSRNRKLFLWPPGAIFLGILFIHFLATNPFGKPRIPLPAGVAAWFADMALVFILWAHPLTARIGVILAGLFLAVPCFLQAPPLIRFALMCGMFLPFAIAATPMLAPAISSYRARLAFLSSWLYTRQLKLRPREFDMVPLFYLLLAAAVCAVAMTAIIKVPASGFWLIVRWLAGAIMLSAFAGMLTAGHNFLTALMGVTAPSLMLSPWLSASVSEFWNKRWNPGMSVLFCKIVYEPLARRNPALALFAAFVLSALMHMAVFYMAMGRWGIALANGAFFLVQPFLILAERWLGVRQWSPAAGRAWTLAVLAIVSPLFVEPALQVVESSWGAQNSGLPPTLVLLVSAIVIEAFFSLAALISCSGDDRKALSPAKST